MTKGYCPYCGDEIDEVDYTQYDGMCYYCSRAKFIIGNIREVKNHE